MICQTKDTTRRLLAAGLRRSDFRVRTPRNRQGEYGTPDITILRPLTGQDVVNLIAAGFDIHGVVAGPHVSLWPVWRPEGEAARVSIEIDSCLQCGREGPLLKPDYFYCVHCALKSVPCVSGM